MNLNEQDEFDKLYKDLSRPGAFTNKIKLYLKRNQTHSLHRPKRKIFLRRKIVTHYPGHIVQSDLIDMQKFSANNSGYSYILVVVDCFSKYLWCLPMKSKNGKETAESLRIIFSKMKYPVQTMIFDQGLEYLNQQVKNFFSERGKKFLSTSKSMIFIPVMSHLHEIKIDLKRTYSQAEIGLLDFAMTARRTSDLIAVSCDQIDSTIENPKRILKVS